MSDRSIVRFSNVFAQFRLKRAERAVRKGRLSRGASRHRSGARAGHVVAQYHLARTTAPGRLRTFGQRGDPVVREPAKAGHTDAQFEIGVLLLADRDAGWCVGPSAQWVAAAADRGSHLRVSRSGRSNLAEGWRARLLLAEQGRGGRQAGGAKRTLDG